MPIPIMFIKPCRERETVVNCVPRAKKRRDIGACTNFVKRPKTSPGNEKCNDGGCDLCKNTIDC
jgi:hypothetical protein